MGFFFCHSLSVLAFSSLPVSNSCLSSLPASLLTKYHSHLPLNLSSLCTSLSLLSLRISFISVYLRQSSLSVILLSLCVNVSLSVPLSALCVSLSFISRISLSVYFLFPLLSLSLFSGSVYSPPIYLLTSLHSFSPHPHPPYASTMRIKPEFICVKSLNAHLLLLVLKPHCSGALATVAIYKDLLRVFIISHSWLSISY